MKIIFLDMDGVLCTIRSHIGQNQRGLMQALDREAVGLLNRLHDCGDEPVRYVLSSTWRLLYDAAWMTAHLRGFGWTGSFHEDWRTKEGGRLPSGLYTACSRGTEIAEWLSRHPEVKRYLILDDDSDMLEEQKASFVQTHPYDGMSWQNFQEASFILHGETDAWCKSPAPCDGSPKGEDTPKAGLSAEHDSAVGEAEVPQ